ncbi:MAG: hypothetical protein KVP17_001339 [Porospora cf. gigantea B]|uniref:uncharacterized protein n=1 Tax=Porospora cf. gigantea B TaxID=2853592 RepID=UPI003571E5AE|nr:MAG: hypothetical protein KVP17_001339 [Porospora cf. gigantea B]
MIEIEMAGSQVKFTWRCVCQATKLGDSLFVIGSHRCVGGWTVKNAVKLQTDPQSFPLWFSNDIELDMIEIYGDSDKAAVVEYKFIILKSSGAVVWESFHGNRKIDLNQVGSLGSQFNYGWHCKLDEVWSDCQSQRISFSPLPPPSSGYVPHPVPSRHDSGALNERPQNIMNLPDYRTRIDRDKFIVANTGDIHRDYVLLQTVGRGTWGEVRAAKSIQSGDLRATKKIPKCFVEDFERFRQEVDIMKSLDHPNIVRLYETYEDMTDIFLVMEYCQGGELFDRLVQEGNFGEETAAKIMKQIIQAVAYCHGKRVAHRDLKPENFLFLTNDPDSSLKLIDFGLACRFRSGIPMKTCAGTPYYVAPQVLDGRYGPECDIWSAGVMLYILLSGHPPFAANSDSEILRKVKQGQFDFPIQEWKHASNQARSMVKGMLMRDPEMRLTPDECLNHPWLQSYAKGNLRDRTFGPSDVFAKFRRFTGLSRLRKIALTIIATQISDESEVEELKALFMTLDTNNDGVLSATEIRMGLEACKSSRLPADYSHQLDHILRSVDTSGTGCIDYTEFVAACMNRHHYQREEACRKAFRILDRDGDGRIDNRELRSIFSMAGGLDDDDILEALDEADAESDGSITFNQFFKLMTRIPSRSLLNFGGDEKSKIMMQRVSSRSSLSLAALCCDGSSETM